MPDSDKSLTGVRVLAALNGLELFGHERGNIEVFKTLCNQGAQVMVGVNAQPDNQVREELRRLGFATISLPFGPQWSIQWVRKKPSIALTNLLAVLRCSWIFRHAIRQFRPTHIHLGSPLAYSYLSLALGLCKTPLVYRMGDCPPVDSPFNMRIWRMAMNRTVCVVSISEYVRKTAFKAGARNISVIHNLAPARSDACMVAAQLPDENGKTNLLYVGAVSEHKGLVPLVEAFAHIAQVYPSLKLDILGGSRYDANFRGYLIRLIASKHLEDRVTFHGHVDDPTSFYRRASIHVAPSICEEALGNVVLEAKREGTPSIVFPSGGLPEMVRHQVDGYICHEKSVDTLVEGLHWMLADPARLHCMGKAAREDSEIRFGRQRFARAWADAYRAAG